ncbi:hypothetical protein [Desmospora profundinema]|uniref:Glycerophosphoryl diester phosphodiesterase membrane domain-containing protein n=1 Tax=Desmospora profundinema TaxID=1571184 RepID=A0ABU1IP59_9BACL|nr:hypothetical protein [Desmospora profundinema]MDR6226506.1 hypothetical protein [Desmospora profundinema]
MPTTWEMLKKHGLKMWGTNLLGHLLTYAVLSVIYFILYFVFVIFFIALFAFVEGGGADPFQDGFVAMMGFILVVSLVFGLISALVYSLVVSGSFSMVSEVVWRDRFQFATYFQHGFRLLWKTIQQMLLLCLLSIPICLPFFFSLFGLVWSLDHGDGSSVILLALLTFLSLIPILLFTLATLHAPVILVAEERGPWQSLKDSLHLFTNRFGTVFRSGLSLLGFFFFYPVAMIPSLLMMAAGEANEALALLSILFYLLSIAVIFLALPFVQIACQVSIVRRYKEHLRRDLAGVDAGPGPWGESNSYGFMDPASAESWEAGNVHPEGFNQPNRTT